MGCLASSLVNFRGWVIRQWRRWRGSSRYEAHAPAEPLASAAEGDSSALQRKNGAHVQKGDTYKATTSATASATVRPKYSWEIRKRLDPEDYMLRGLSAETRLKWPGEIDGQQFLIDNCNACHIFLFDRSAAVTVEKCEDCTIVIGPVEGSIFIRECSRCTIAVVCQQFRSRECSSIDTFLYSCTGPIIEESVNMRFGCYDIEYKGLPDQMKQAGISPFSNCWSDVYDYTPGDGHINFIPQGECASVACFSAAAKSSLDLPHDFLSRDNSYILKTLGSSSASTSLREEECFVLMDETEAPLARKLIHECSMRGARLTRTSRLKIAASAVRDIMLQAEWHQNKPLFFANVPEAVGIGLELRGLNSLDHVLSALPSTSTALVTSNMQVVEEYRRLRTDE